jgi:hypothetical protein
MSLKKYHTGFLLFFTAFALVNCTEKKQAAEVTAFTKTDSLTDTYLALQDSMLWAWNMMINDDNRKIKAMHDLAHHLMVSNESNKDELMALEQRLEQLAHLRYSQKTMANDDVVAEYDFACQSLISELTTLAESSIGSSDDSTIQELVDQITIADQRVSVYRDEYDSIAKDFNAFLDENKAYLKDIDRSCSLDKKPLFEMSDNN